MYTSSTSERHIRKMLRGSLVLPGLIGSQFGSGIGARVGASS